MTLLLIHPTLTYSPALVVSNLTKSSDIHIPAARNFSSASATDNKIPRCFAKLLMVKRQLQLL